MEYSDLNLRIFEIMAFRNLCLLGFATLCVLLGVFLLCRRKTQNQGELSVNAGKIALAMREVHAGVVLVVFGVCVALYMIGNPPTYKYTRYHDGSAETVMHSAPPIERESKHYDETQMVGAPMPTPTPTP